MRFVRMCSSARCKPRAARSGFSSVAWAGAGDDLAAAARWLAVAGAIRDRHDLPLPEDGRPRHDQTAAAIRAAGIDLESTPDGITTDDEAVAVAEALGEPGRPEPAGLLGLLDGIDLSLL